MAILKISDSLLPELSIDDIIDETDLNKYYFTQITILYLIQILYFSSYQFLNIIIPTLEIEFNLSNFEISLIGGLDYFGIFLGSLMIHFFADKFGRRKSYIGSLLTFILLQCLTTLSTNIYIFCFFRSLQSISATFVMLLAFILVAESLPTKFRGFFSKFFSVLAIIGHLFCIFITMLIYDDLLSINWRKLTFFFAALTLILLVIAFLYIDESPRFDIFNGDKNRGFATLNKMRGIKGYLTDDEKINLNVGLRNSTRI